MTATMTILWITMHGGPMDGDTFGIPYLTPEACEAAMRPVGDTLDYDWSMECAPVTVEGEQA